MIKIHRAISTCLGIGFIGRGSGTVAALVAAVLWYLFCKAGAGAVIQITTMVVISAVGVWSASMVEAGWGKDSSKVVIDEVAGMCTSLLFVPVTIKWVVIGLVLFRFFDIVKPWPVSWADRELKGGLGVMFDDMLAGLYPILIYLILMLEAQFMHGGNLLVPVTRFLGGTYVH